MFGGAHEIELRSSKEPAVMALSEIEPPMAIAGFLDSGIPAFLMNVPFLLSSGVPNNIFMQNMSDLEREIDHGLAHRQFMDLYAHVASKAHVYLLPSNEGLQDQVYVANLGVLLAHLPEQPVVLSNYYSEPRRGEEHIGEGFLSSLGLKTIMAPPFFEGEADLKYLYSNIYVGAYGMRTSLACLEWFAEEHDMQVVPIKLTNPYLYHLDCCVFPLSSEKTMICTDVLTRKEVRALERVTEIVDVSLEHCLGGITNCVRIGDQILCDNHLDHFDRNSSDYSLEVQKVKRLDEIAAQHGLEPIYFNLSEFMKSGAALSCLIMHLNYSNFPRE
ncbi:MAG: dimethylarginine dimethylaminohydrolase family protein [Sulfitobacter sp.]